MRQLYPLFQRLKPYLLVMLYSLLACGLLHSIPTRHVVDIGGYDSSYVQGFYDQQPIPAGYGRPGNARWSGPEAALRLPLLGIPARLTVTVRAPVPRLLTLVTADPDVPQGVQQQVPTDWHTETIDILGVFVKFTDTPVAFRSETAPYVKGDLRPVGVLLDTISYETDWGARPYPSTTLATVLTSLLLALAARARAPSLSRREVLIAVLAPQLVVALFWRFPLTSALVIPDAHWYALVLAALFASVVHLQRVARVWMRYQVVGGTMLIGAWYAWYAYLQTSHLTLVVPGVEKDFRSFATRADSLAGVFRADGFYQLGYPWLLWVGQQLSHLPVFAVATTGSVVAALVTVAACWWIARMLYGAGWDLVAVCVLLASAFFGDAALLIGSDMPFTAAVTVALALLLWANQRPLSTQRWWLLGVMIGAALLIRHTGLVLVLPVGVALLLQPDTWRLRARRAAVTLLGWVVVAAPQLWVNLRDTGQLFYNTQAKNSWLAVYGGMDWGRWDDVPDTISLTTVILNDPGRFAASWWHNITLILGSGATDQQYDSALWQRLLSVPYNWLGLIGIVWIGTQCFHKRLDPVRTVLASWAVSFVAVSAVAFVLPRLLLPVIVVAAVTATDGIRLIFSRVDARWRLGLGAVLVFGMIHTAGVSRDRLQAGQPADERAALALVETLHPRRLAVLVPAESPAGKYSALAAVTVLRHTKYPVAEATLCDAQPDYVVWSNELVPPFPALVPLAHIGRYWVFRMADTPGFCPSP